MCFGARKSKSGLSLTRNYVTLWSTPHLVACENVFSPCSCLMILLVLKHLIVHNIAPNEQFHPNPPLEVVFSQSCCIPSPLLHSCQPLLTLLLRKQCRQTAYCCFVYRYRWYGRGWERVGSVGWWIRRVVKHKRGTAVLKLNNQKHRSWSFAKVVNWIAPPSTSSPQTRSSFRSPPFIHNQLHSLRCWHCDSLN